MEDPDAPDFKSFRANRIAVYDGSIRYIDDQIRRFRDRLEEMGILRDSLVVAFSDRREVAALQADLSTPDAATAMARELGPGWLSPNSGLDPAALGDPLERLALDVLQDPRTTLRYDGSDRMPPAVGAGSLPRALTAWVTGTTSTDALAAAEAGWPR